MRNVLNGFREFIMRGNALDLAIGVVIGAAFGALVTSVVDGLINPLIAMIFGKQDLAHTMAFTINNAHFSCGLILGALLNFLAVAAVIYFAVVVPINHLQRLRKRGVTNEPEAPAEDVILLAEIRDLLVAQNGGGMPPSFPASAQPPGR
jgi:large conductance mechanosensitive channel